MSGIIVEGAEQQGKTTFVEKLKNMTGLEIIHMHKNYGFINGKFDYVNSYFVDIKKHPEGLIFDRHYLSEICYGKLFARNNITNMMRNIIEERLNKFNYMLIVLDMTDDWIEREETISKEQNVIIKQYFKEEFNKSKINYKYYINPKNDNDVKVVQEAWKNLM